MGELDRPRRRGRLELLRAESRQPQLDPSPRASLWEALDIAKIRRKPQSQTRPSSGNVGYIGAKQTWETAMDDEVANAGKTDSAFDTSCSGAGAGLHRGSFRRTDRVVAGKGRRSRATRHHECDRPGSPRNGTQPICAVRALDGRLHRFRDGAPCARSDRARKSVSSLMKSSPPSAIPGAFRHPDARLRRATASDISASRH